MSIEEVAVDAESGLRLLIKQKKKKQAGGKGEEEEDSEGETKHAVGNQATEPPKRIESDAGRELSRFANWQHVQQKREKQKQISEITDGNDGNSGESI